MDFELNEEQRAFRDAAKAFAEDVFAPNAAEWDSGSIFSCDELRQAAALGFAGIYCREAHGGSDLKRQDATVIFEELSAGCATSAYMSIHNMASWMIDRFGNDEQRIRCPNSRPWNTSRVIV